MPQNPLEERRPAITPQLAVRVAVLGGIAFVVFGVVFFRLWFLQVLSGEDYVSIARENKIRKEVIEAPRGDVVDRHGRVLVKTRVAPVVQIEPGSLPDQRARAGRRVPRGARGRRERAARRGFPLRTLERDIRDRRGDATRAERRERRRLRSESESAQPVAIPPVPAEETRAAPALPAARARDRRAAADDPPARDRGHRRDAVLERHDPHRRRSRRVQLHPRAPRAVPRRRGLQALPARLPARRARRPALRHHARDLAGRAQAGALPRRRAGHAHRRRRHRGVVRRVPARHRRVHAHHDQRARHARRPAPDDPQGADAGSAAAAHARPQAPARGQRRAQDRGRRGRAERRARRRLRRHEPRERRDPRARLLPELRRQPVRPPDLAAQVRRAPTPRRTARRCSTARSPRPIRPARRSSR